MAAAANAARIDKVNTYKDGRIVSAPQQGDITKKPSFLSGSGGLSSTTEDYYRFCQMVLNGGQANGRRYIKATIQVQFYDAIVPPEFHERLPQTRDMLLTLLSSKTFADVRTPQGKAVLREEIVNRLNTVLNEDAVKAIYFTEFIVQ